jgi:AcrR family transcriptional regulator
MVRRKQVDRRANGSRASQVRAPQRIERSDARRNRVRILAIADAVFGANGPAASTEEIARHAGVAIGTIFRHFPTKAALVQAVFIDRLRRLAKDARELASGADVGTAFFDFFRRWADLAATKQAFADALQSEGVDVAVEGKRGEYPEARRELLEAVETLLKRARSAGTVRKDVGITELNALLIGTARAIEHARTQPSVAARTLDVVLDGLRPPQRRAARRRRSQ